MVPLTKAVISGCCDLNNSSPLVTSDLMEAPDERSIDLH